MTPETINALFAVVGAVFGLATPLLVAWARNLRANARPDDDWIADLIEFALRIASAPDVPAAAKRKALEAALRERIKR